MKRRLIGVVCLFAFGCLWWRRWRLGFQTNQLTQILEMIQPSIAISDTGTYNGTAYSALGQPTGLTENYPSVLLNNLHNALQIAYGNNSESQIANLTAYVTMGNSLCSATPVHYESSSNTTFLIGAAHCFAQNKTSPTTLYSGNLLPTSSLTVYNGVSQAKGWVNQYPVTAVYLRQDYCYKFNLYKVVNALTLRQIVEQALKVMILR